MNKELLTATLISYISANSHIGIKGGLNRATFLDIWIVAVDQRIFARSWGMNKRSWFTEFVEQGVGQLKYGDYILDVRGQQVKDTEMNALISQAYRDKYVQPKNKFYVDGITELNYNNFTMEFFA